MRRRMDLTAFLTAAVLGMGIAAVTVRADAAGKSSGSSPAGQGAESPDLSADADSSLYEFLGPDCISCTLHDIPPAVILVGVCLC